MFQMTFMNDGIQTFVNMNFTATNRYDFDKKTRNPSKAEGVPHA